MLRTATFLGRQGVFNRFFIFNPVKIVPTMVKNPKKLRPLKGMSTGCNEEPPPILCPPELSLMDYAPMPEGCWKEKYDKDNKKANKSLAIGFVSLTLSIFAVYKNGWIKGYDFSIFETDD